MIRELIGHSAAYTFSNLLARATTLVWLVVLPSFMSPADYGVLGLVITTAALVNVLVPLEVGQGMARFYATAPESERGSWAATAWTFTIFMLSATAALALVLSPWLNQRLLGPSGYLADFRLAILYFVLNTSFLFVQNLFRWQFKTVDYAIATTAGALITLVLSTGLAASLPNALGGVLVGLLAGTGAGLALGLVGLRGSPGLEIDRAKLKRMLRFSLPLVPASAALFLSTYVSRFIVNDLLTLADVGLFTWASQLAIIPALSLIGVQAAVTPLVMKHHAEAATRSILARSFETTFAATMCLCVAIGLFTPELISLLGYGSFAGAGEMVMILAPAYLMLQLYIFAPGFAVRERTDLQLVVALASGLLSVALNYWLIKALGLEGAALATLASGSIFLGGWMILSQRLYPIPVRWVKLGLFAFAALLVAIAARLLAQPSLEASALKVLLLGLLVLIAGAIGLVRTGPLRRLVQSRLGNQPSG